MSFLADLASGGVAGLLTGIGSLAKDIKQVVTGEIGPDVKAALDTKLAELTVAVQLAQDQYDSDVIKNQGAIILAEARNESWLTRNWRPLLMMTFIVIIANNYIVFPYAQLFTTRVIMLDLPADMWSLLKIGVGGYLTGRSAEKVMKLYKGK